MSDQMTASNDTSTSLPSDLPVILQQSIKVLKGFSQQELMRAGAVILQDLGIEHPHHEWAANPAQLGDAMRVELFGSTSGGSLREEYVHCLKEIHRVGNIRFDAGQMAVAVSAIAAMNLFSKVATQRWQSSE
jgi:hypothetical protein